MRPATCLRCGQDLRSFGPGACALSLRPPIGLVEQVEPVPGPFLVRLPFPEAACLDLVQPLFFLGQWFVVRIDVLRSEEHTSELQSRGHLVCRLLLEKKKRYSTTYTILLKHQSIS